MEFDIVLTVHHDKLYNKTNEMHCLEFYSDNILHMFRIGKLFIFRRQFLLYMKFVVRIMHSRGLAATKITASPQTACAVKLPPEDK